VFYFYVTSTDLNFELHSVPMMRKDGRRARKKATTGSALTAGKRLSQIINIEYGAEKLPCVLPVGECHPI